MSGWIASRASRKFPRALEEDAKGFFSLASEPVVARLLADVTEQARARLTASRPAISAPNKARSPETRSR